MTQFKVLLFTVKVHIDGSMQKEMQLQRGRTGAKPLPHQAIYVRIAAMFLISISRSRHCGCWWSIALPFKNRQLLWEIYKFDHPFTEQ